MLLEVRNLSTDFVMNKGTVHAVIDVSFSVREGEVLAIVGESGSGKSVTSLSVMGLLQPPGRVVAGEVLYRGRDLLKLSKSEMRAHPRRPDLDDLPGADDEPEPGLHRSRTSSPRASART